MGEWLENDDELIDVFMTREGLRGLPAPHCSACSALDALYWCLDCVNKPLLCQSCIVAAHESAASGILHGIKVIHHYPLSQAF